MVEQGWVHEECSEKLGFVVYRAVISMMVLRLEVQEQSEARPVCSLDLPECHEGYYQLRFRLRARHQPCCAFNARDECDGSARDGWSQPAPPTLRARSQLTNGDTAEVQEHNSRSLSDGQAKIRNSGITVQVI